jgi:hypothetical protein
VNVWAFYEKSEHLKNYEGEIVAIQQFFDGFAIATDKGTIYIWDSELR